MVFTLFLIFATTRLTAKLRVLADGTVGEGSVV